MLKHLIREKINIEEALEELTVRVCEYQKEEF